MAAIVGTFPNTIKNGDTEDATVVMALFSFIQSQVNSNACPKTTGGGILKGDGLGGTQAAVAGTDFMLPATLAGSGGAALVGDASGTTVGDRLNAIYLADYTALRAYAGSSKVTYISGYLVSAAPAGTAGFFTRDDNDTTSSDNGGTIIVASNGKRWKRVYSGPLHVGWFGAKGDGVTDDTAAFQSALSYLSTGGGQLYAKAATYIVSGLLSIPAAVTLMGDAFRGTIIQQNGSAFALAMGTGGSIQNLKLQGSVSATGGIDLTNCGFGTVRNVDIENFTATGATAYKLSNTLRVLIDGGYIFNCYTGSSFANAVTTTKFHKVNFGSCTYRAIDASTAAGANIELYFDTCYFESCTGINPIYSNMFGRITFENCGFESMCGSGANPILIDIENPCRVTLRSCQFSGFNTGTYTYTGTAYFVYLGNDMPKAVIEDCVFIQNATVSGFTLRVLRCQNPGSLAVRDTRLEGTALANDLEAQRTFLAAMDATYLPTTYVFENVRALGAIIDRIKVESSVTSIVNSSGTTSTLWSKQFPGRSFQTGSLLRLRAWGQRTAAFGAAMQVQFQINAGTASAMNVTASLNTATDWRSEVTIAFQDYNTQNISIVAQDGTATSVTSTQLTKDTITNDPTLSLLAQCANAGDTIKLCGMTLEWL